MRAIKLLTVFCCMLVLSCDLFDDDSEVADRLAEITDRLAKTAERDALEDSVKQAAGLLKSASTFEDVTERLTEFREGKRSLVFLTSGGGVYAHITNRELEDQDWSDLEDAKGRNVGGMFIGMTEGGFVKYYMEGEENPRESYAFPIAASSVPLSNPFDPAEQNFILVGGFDYQPPEVEETGSYEEIASYYRGLPPIPYVQAKEVKNWDSQYCQKLLPGEEQQQCNMLDQDELRLLSQKTNLRRFVDSAIHYFTGALVDPAIDVVLMRRLFRFENGPWRYISTYIYIMDDKGNVIFNGANRNIEQTNLLNDPDVGDTIRDIIDAAIGEGGDLSEEERGFVRYSWDDPAVVGDEPSKEGGAGGGSPKLGYAKSILINKDAPDNEDKIYYIFGSGLYLGE